MKKQFVTVWLLLLTCFSHAQFFEADSLKALLQKPQTDTSRFNTLTSIAYHYRDSKADSVFLYARQALDLSIHLNDSRLTSKAYSTLSLSQILAGNYSQALQLLFKAHTLSENVNDKQGMALAHNLIGVTYKEYGQYDKAIDNFYECLKLAREIHSNEYKLYAYMNLGQVYCLVGKPDSALVIEQQAYAIATSEQSPWQGAVLMSLGLIYAELNDTEQAFNYFQTAINNLKTDFGNCRILSRCYLHFAEFYFASNKSDSAIVYANKAMQAAEAVPYLKGMADAGKFLSGLHDSQHQTDSAYAYQKLFVSINDSINSRAKVIGVEQVAIEEKIKQQEKEQNEQALQQAQKEKFQYGLIFLSIMLLGIVFLTLSRTVVVSEKLISFLGVLLLLVIFEFLNAIAYIKLAAFTDESPIQIMVISVAIASVLIPAHHYMEKWINEKVIEKNKAIRIATAKNTSPKL